MLKFKPIVNLAFSRSSFDRISKLFNHVSINRTTSCSLYTSCLLGKIPGMVYPHGYSFDWAWKARIPNIDIYTHEALPKVKTGGRGPNGRLALKHIGGGLKRPHFMVSPFRGGLSNGSEDVIEEKVLYIHKNWWRHEMIALVARNTKKRWVYATTSMKVGDIIRSYAKIDKLISYPKEGDAYAVGCLPVGSIVCQIEKFPGDGAHYAVKAGASGTIQQKYSDNTCLIKMGKRILKVSTGCAVVLGQMSNPGHKNERFTKFGQKRWLGIKQRSGLFQRKTGRFGRRIRPPRLVDNSLTKDVNVMCEVTHTKYDKPLAARKSGTAEAPVNVTAIPVEEGQLHPRFTWCSWSSVR